MILLNQIKMKIMILLNQIKIKIMILLNQILNLIVQILITLPYHISGFFTIIIQLVGISQVVAI